MRLGTDGPGGGRNLYSDQDAQYQKGPAVHSLRAQQDKKAISALMKEVLENTDNLQLVQDEITEILTDDEKSDRRARRDGRTVWGRAR